MTAPSSNPPTCDCEKPGPQCQRERRWSRNLSRYIWVCPAGRAFLENSNGKPSDTPLRSDPSPLVLCPLCEASMSLVRGTRNGDFWSCSRYPLCRGTRQAKDVQPN